MPCILSPPGGATLLTAGKLQVVARVTWLIALSVLAPSASGEQQP